MKITIIHGQSHHGSTCHIARSLAQKLHGTITEIFLPRDFGEFCTGCTACFHVSETKCPHYKQLSPITKALDDADIIILASPVYVYHATGAMKSFLDHYGWRWMVHRPEEKMFSKQAVCISTAAGAGMKSTNQDMAHSMFFWGIAKTYSYGAAVMETSWEKVSPRKKRAIEKKTKRISAKNKERSKTDRTICKNKDSFSCYAHHGKTWMEQSRSGLLESQRMDGKKAPMERLIIDLQTVRPESVRSILTNSGRTVSK